MTALQPHGRTTLPTRDQSWHAELTQKLCDIGLIESQSLQHEPDHYMIYNIPSYGHNDARKPETWTSYERQLMHQYISLTNELVRQNVILADGQVVAGSFKILSIEAPCPDPRNDTGLSVSSTILYVSVSEALRKQTQSDIRGRLTGTELGKEKDIVDFVCDYLLHLDRLDNLNQFVSFSQKYQHRLHPIVPSWNTTKADETTRLVGRYIDQCLRLHTIHQKGENGLTGLEFNLRAVETYKQRQQIEQEYLSHNDNDTPSTSPSRYLRRMVLEARPENTDREWDILARSTSKAVWLVAQHLGRGFLAFADPTFGHRLRNIGTNALEKGLPVVAQNLDLGSLAKFLDIHVTKQFLAGRSFPLKHIDTDPMSTRTILERLQDALDT